MPRANEMLRADSRMMVVFGALSSKPEQLTFEESLIFVKKVKARDYMLYLSLFDVLGRTELPQLDAYRELQQMFQNHPDLREELERFRPPPPPPVPTSKQAANNNIWPWVIVCAAVPLVAASLLPSL
ncbi:uncharacterized protein [Zea mays]|nr:uncharacterized protein LOC100216763 [Zea mays]NP_001346424.1 uncharacterized protein LOC100216763 [Zea mays]XP_008654473.1 uncharacterized protein LOC100216763 isoform X2 [Zea mays]XP_008654474.1 uncharacterized protein LOC100216763 isoform X2 [Zea mays]XP_020397515.1 uncharacterized protein LOC100216763 isoform X2 [Zea mays]ACF81833.1 unknown [Zea mays]ACF82313.1 unknown [Zea mays]AQK89860.1 hypothetical protein ZEAMMB73_Zm00001d008430 [Zea mays]AQK89861.1 hypothetical protein ZEAMMB73|eukprot:NP_001136635.1 uncharacterized protein LOC100216763 [Zea mays]